MVHDAFNRDVQNSTEIGRRIILPSSYIGGPRHMAQLYQDALAIVRTLGKPDLFVTMTCNPHWPEIQRELLPSQTANDRNDIVTRIFRQKYLQCAEDIYKRNIFGKHVGHVHTIEFQKRGLPHVHMLIILSNESKPTTIDDFDSIVSAQIPDPLTDPITHKTVTKHMMHGPCGPAFPDAPCMKENSNGVKKCSKG